MARNKTIDERIKEAKKKKEQYEQRMKELKQQQSELERKARTKRLIERGAILEKQIEGAEALTNDQIKLFLEMTLHTGEASEALTLVREQDGTVAEVKPDNPQGNTAKPDNGTATEKPAGAEQNNGADASRNEGGGARQAG